MIYKHILSITFYKSFKVYEKCKNQLQDEINDFKTYHFTFDDVI